MNKLQKLRARLGEVRDEMRTIAETDADTLTEEQEARFAQLETELEAEVDGETRGLLADIAREERREALLAKADEFESRGVAVGEPGDDRGVPNVNAGKSKEDPYDLRSVQSFGRSRSEVTAELRSRALTAVEKHKALDDDQKRAVTDALEQRSTKNHRIRDAAGFIPEYVLRTGSDTYHDAFMRYMAGAEHLLTDEQRRAVADAEEVRAAMSLTDANGGYAVPFTLDPTLIDTGSGSVNPFRQISRVETISTDSWNGLSSAGVTASYDAENSEVSDDSPTFAQPTVPVHQARAFAQGSIQITQDYVGLVSDLQIMFATAKDDLNATKFAVGSGSGEPTGIVTALDGTSSEIAPTTVETFAVADLYKVEEALAAKYRARAQWVANKAIYNDIRQFGTSDSHALWERLGAGQPPRLLGYPAHEASAMDSGFDAGATADNFLLILGDWSNFLIADRVGMVVEFIPHLFHTTTNLPKGTRGWFAHWRDGSDSVNDGAFKMLNVATTL